jgi:predicted lipid-binding transport protein (Tim44 family)
MRYPGENLQHVVDRAKEVFETLQQAWTSGNWEQARAFETDRLFQVHTFWMESFKRKKLRNVIEQVKVLRITIAKLGRDAYYELATLRIKASMLDYTQDAEGKVVAGSDKKPRTFSEYWTFIRRAGFEPGKELSSSSCPSCGAPTKVSMHGRCDYCDANLSSGDFDWTLAKIEQDEVYVG